MIRSRAAAWCATLGIVASMLAVAPPSSGEDLVLGTVYGTVTGPDGEPIRGAVVTSYYQGPDGWNRDVGGVLTDADGAYALLLAPGETYRLEVAADGHATEFWNDVGRVEDAQDIRLTNAQPTRAGVDARLVPLGSITGKVVDQDGDPVAGAFVSAYDDRYELISTTSPTETEGRFTIPDIPPAAYRLRVTIPDNKELAPEWLHDGEDFTTATPVVVRSGEAVDGIVAELGPPGQITGTVRLASGLPADQWTNVIAVQRLKGEWTYGGEGFTRADGTFEIDGLGTGDYRVGVNGDGSYLPDYYPGAVTIDQATPVHVVAGEVVGGIGLVRDPVGQLSGRVRSDQGAPLAGVEVQLFRKSGATWPTQVWGAAKTDANGDYLLDGVWPGTYRVLFGSPGYGYHREFWSNTRTFDGATEIVLGRSQRLGGIDAALAPASAIRGRVANSGGAPLPGISVVAFIKTATGYRRYASTVTEPDGRYRVVGLDPGRYRLAFGDTRGGIVYYLGEYWNREGGAGSLPGGADIAVPRSGATSGINARLVRGATVSGRVVDKSGWPFLGLRVYRFETGRWRARPVTSLSPGGRFSLRLDAGRYRLAFLGVDNNVLEFWDDATRFKRARDITLRPGSNVTGVNALTTGAVPPPEVGLTRMPGLRGRAVVGETLQVEDVFVTPEDATVGYQWYLDDQPVRAATAPTFRVEQHMVGRRVSVLVTGSMPGLRPLRILLLAEIAIRP